MASEHLCCRKTLIVVIVVASIHEQLGLAHFVAHAATSWSDPPPQEHHLCVMSLKINARLDCECAFLARGRNGYGVSGNGGFARQAHGFFEWSDC